MKISKFIYIIFFFAAFMSSVPVLAAEGDALGRLLEGNKRFMTGVPARKDISDKKRREAANQQPLAIVFTCSDSQVPPEMIFDQGLGDLYVIRNAGNIVDPSVIGSMEYAVESLHVPLIIVLGHADCGVVKAAMETKGEPEGAFGEIIKKIMVAVKRAKRAGNNTLDASVRENVKNTCTEIVRYSKVIQKLVNQRKVNIVAGEYYPETGEVRPVF